ncbi:hypothetical protein, partial [Bacteroides pyogenes]|uniref:hypothetical protein n=1 Tax=Bacteroides pyogenes TaxID=310300 RepID=UPI002A90B9F1
LRTNRIWHSYFYGFRLLSKSLFAAKIRSLFSPIAKIKPLVLIKLLITHPRFIRLPFGRRMSLKRKTNGTRSADELLLLQNKQVIAMQGNKKRMKTEAKN